MSKGESGIQPTKVPERSVDKKPTIYAFETCPFCWKVRSLLSWKGVDYRQVEVDPMKKTELKWSEWNATPVFVDRDGTQVNDSNDILHYINSNYEGGEKFPVKGSDEAQDQWMNFSGDILGKSILPVIYNSYSSSRRALRYVSDVESFSALQKWKAIWLGGIIMRMVGKSRGKMFELPAEENLTYQLDVLSGGFTGDFFGGSSPNGADFANYGILRSMQGLRGWNIVESHAKAGPWFALMQSTTGV